MSSFYNAREENPKGKVGLSSIKADGQVLVYVSFCYGRDAAGNYLVVLLSTPSPRVDKTTSFQVRNEGLHIVYGMTVYWGTVLQCMRDSPKKKMQLYDITGSLKYKEVNVTSRFCVAASDVAAHFCETVQTNIAQYLYDPITQAPIDDAVTVSDLSSATLTSPMKMFTIGKESLFKFVKVTVCAHCCDPSCNPDTIDAVLHHHRMLPLKNPIANGEGAILGPSLSIVENFAVNQAMKSLKGSQPAPEDERSAEETLRYVRSKIEDMKCTDAWVNAVEVPSPPSRRRSPRYQSTSLRAVEIVSSDED